MASLKAALKLKLNVHVCLGWAKCVMSGGK